MKRNNGVSEAATPCSKFTTCPNGQPKQLGPQHVPPAYSVLSVPSVVNSLRFHCKNKNPPSRSPEDSLFLQLFNFLTPQLPLPGNKLLDPLLLAA